MVSKKNKQAHEQKYNHTLADKGTIVKLYDVPKFEVVLPIAQKKSVRRIFTGNARKDFSKVYEVMDAFRGMFLIENLLSNQGENYDKTISS